ncbi:MAG TPA: DUF397 domain-containing protein [Trebonia sp.]|nr:DUF397 domain-containing protein [Trebonia sp.]
MEVISANWRTSSYSASNGGQCVEVGTAAHRVAMPAILVRDSTDHSGPVLTVAPAAWRSLTAAIRADRPPTSL